MKTKIIDSKHYVFDFIRKKWLLLTPEEMVRQQVVSYLINEKNVPQSLIALEKTIQINNFSKRFDILVYKEDKPWLLVECKEPNVVLNDTTIQQILHYNQALNVPFLAITNGEQLLVWQVADQLIQLQDFPRF